MSERLQNGRCANCAIRHRAICGALSNGEIQSLSRIAHSRTLTPGETLMSDAEPTEYFANVISGVVKLLKTSADGRQQILGLLFPTDFLGRAYSTENPYFAEAATAVEICCFPHQAFEKLLTDHPDLERRLFERTLSELDAAREWLFVLGRASAEEKVASFLSMMARRAPNLDYAEKNAGAPAHFLLPLTRPDIADFLGLTNETVSRQFSKLNKRGIIRLVTSREVVVPDLTRLAETAGQTELAFA